MRKKTFQNSYVFFGLSLVLLRKFFSSAARELIKQAQIIRAQDVSKNLDLAFCDELL